MTWLSIFAVAVSLGMDAFAVAVAAGLAVTPLTGRHLFRLSFHFGLFQFLMPVLGWAVGANLARYIGGYDHWVAFGLLTLIGGHMLLEARHAKEAGRRDPTRGARLVLFSIATSIDALAVGVVMAMESLSVWLPSVVIGLVAAAMTYAGMKFGSRLGRSAGRWAEAVGGLVLVGIGVKMLLSHLLGQA